MKENNRPRISIDEVKGGITSAMKVIDDDGLFVARFKKRLGSEGVCMFFNNKGKEHKIKMMMYNPESENITGAELKISDFNKLFSEIVDKCDFFKIDDNGNDMMEHFTSITDAFKAMDNDNGGSFGGYVARKIDKSEL